MNIKVNDEPVLPRLPAASHSYECGSESDFGASFASLYTESQMQEYALAVRATTVLPAPDRDVEMAKVKCDVDAIGYGFLVDGRRVPLSRITWYNQPGEMTLPERPLPFDERRAFELWRDVPKGHDADLRLGKTLSADEDALAWSVWRGRAYLEDQTHTWNAIPVDQLAALLPGTTYMDEPDGGNVTVLEQLQRMAADAARYRWLVNDVTDAQLTEAFRSIYSWEFQDDGPGYDLAIARAAIDVARGAE